MIPVPFHVTPELKKYMTKAAPVFDLVTVKSLPDSIQLSSALFNVENPTLPLEDALGNRGEEKLWSTCVCIASNACFAS